MGNRTSDRVIYIRTDEKLQAEFEKQKEANGYGSNSDFVDYLLRINEGNVTVFRETVQGTGTDTFGQGKQTWEPFYSGRDQRVYAGERAETGGIKENVQKKRRDRER